MSEIQDLEATTAKLDLSVHSLDLSVATLTVTLNTLAQRAAEDRAAQLVSAAKIEVRLSSMEQWRSRIIGQIGLIAFVLGAVVALVAGKVLHVY